MRFMLTAPENAKSGSKEIIKYITIAVLAKANVVLFPSSYLPYYKNSAAFYTDKDLQKLPGLVAGTNVNVITGVNFIDYKKQRRKTVITFNESGIINLRHKIDLENHYIDKGYISGNDDFKPSVINGINICTLECYEVLFIKNWKERIVTASVGFGMKAITDNYNCDYFNEWLTIVKSNCILTKSWCFLSCNTQHKDFMTAAINPEGELIALVKQLGFCVVDIDDEFVFSLPSKNPVT